MKPKEQNQPGTQQELIPASKPKQTRSSDRAINVKQLANKKYREVELDEIYGPMFGEIEGRTMFMFYGPPGSGKSTTVLQFANHLAEKYGKVLYNSHEEKHNKTLQTRVVNTLGDGASLKLQFAPAWDFETLMSKTKKNKYRVVIIDSVQYMHFSYEQLIKFREAFKKRNIIIILISFGTAWDKTIGANDLLFAVDVKAFIKQGKIKVQSRYLSEYFHKTLFNPNAAKTEDQLL